MVLTPELVLVAYQQGYFPMAEDNGELYWHCPDPRAIVPLDGVKISRSLRKTLQQHVFTTRINTNFDYVIAQCANRLETWISDDIIDIYSRLHQMGYAHSVESWHGGEMVGGLYGVAIGGAFFGESMFSMMDNASKVAFVALTERLRERKFMLLDSQYINPHMQSLGAVDVPRAMFLSMLERALQLRRSFA
jgi:leucyl/phenylalanyl-tRNA--protein transferase